MDNLNDVLKYKYTTNIGTIYSGDAVEWKVDFEKFKPTDNYNLSLIILHPTNTKIILAALADTQTNLFSFSLTNLDTNIWQAGFYNAYLVLGRSQDNFTKQLEFGQLEIKANILTSDNMDVRTHNERVLASILSLIENKVLDDAYNYTINGRMLTKYKHQDLIKLKNQYENLIEKEKASKQLKETGRTNRHKLYVNYKSSLN